MIPVERPPEAISLCPVEELAEAVHLVIKTSAREAEELAPEVRQPGRFGGEEDVASFDRGASGVEPDLLVLQRRDGTIPNAIAVMAFLDQRFPRGGVLDEHLVGLPPVTVPEHLVLEVRVIQPFTVDIEEPPFAAIEPPCRADGEVGPGIGRHACIPALDDHLVLIALEWFIVGTKPLPAQRGAIRGDRVLLILAVESG